MSKERIRPFAVVTGASRGIGAEYARALATIGYDLLLVARDQVRLERMASDLSTKHAVSVQTEVIDLTVPDAAQRLYVASRQCRDHVDLLVNNAGFGAFGPFIELPMPRIQEMLRLHVNTIAESMRLFLPGMVERSSGAVINVASTAGLFSLPFMAEYAAT
ncbi:MAG: SDR family NAD(P)-dependent oxidoreductase, partial [Nitrospirota bacterium]|nr:SDR family NAD(P)-dependent oxidoreductase [Nitrospirota bacterium]